MALAKESCGAMAGFFMHYIKSTSKVLGKTSTSTEEDVDLPSPMGGVEVDHGSIESFVMLSLSQTHIYLFINFYLFNYLLFIYFSIISFFSYFSIIPFFLSFYIFLYFYFIYLFIHIYILPRIF